MRCLPAAASLKRRAAAEEVPYLSTVGIEHSGHGSGVILATWELPLRTCHPASGCIHVSGRHVAQLVQHTLRMCGLSNQQGEGKEEEGPVLGCPERCSRGVRKLRARDVPSLLSLANSLHKINRHR